MVRDLIERGSDLRRLVTYRNGIGLHAVDLLFYAKERLLDLIHSGYDAGNHTLVIIARQLRGEHEAAHDDARDDGEGEQDGPDISLAKLRELGGVDLTVGGRGVELPAIM